MLSKALKGVSVYLEIWQIDQYVLSWSKVSLCSSTMHLMK